VAAPAGSRRSAPRRGRATLLLARAGVPSVAGPTDIKTDKQENGEEMGEGDGDGEKWEVQSLWKQAMTAR